VELCGITWNYVELRGITESTPSVVDLPGKIEG
jgi:hypothetical protein